MFEQKFLLISKAVLFLSIAFSVIMIPFIINRQMEGLRNDTKIQLNAFRTDSISLLDRRLDSLQSLTVDLFNKTDRRIESLQNNVSFQVTDIKNTANGQLSTLNTNVNNQLTTLNTNLNNQIITLNGSISKLSDTYSAVPTEIANRFDTQTNCSINGLCWQNLTTDVLTNFRFTGRDISDASKTFNKGFPKMMEDSEQITSNFAGITKNFNTLSHPRWYDRGFGYLMNGALLYSRINPVSNIVVSLTQTISNQK